MSAKLGLGNLHLCFTKIKRPLPPQSPTPIPEPTLQSPDDHSRPFPSFFIKNFNSVYNHYDHDYLDDHHGDHSFYCTSNSLAQCSSSSSLSAPILPENACAADFTAAFSSHRFFFSSPGRSNSIIESTTSTTTIEPTSPRSSTTSTSKSNNKNDLVFNNSAVAVPTYSPDPFADFRRSMQEMLDSCDEQLMEEKKSRWDFLHELLLCYLAVNPKSNHKFILGAFADLVVSLMPKVTSS